MSALPVAGHRNLELTDDVTDQAGRAVQRHASQHTSWLAYVLKTYTYRCGSSCMANKHDLTSKQGSCTYCWSSFKHVAVPMAPRASPASCRTLPGDYHYQRCARGALQSTNIVLTCNVRGYRPTPLSEC